jgi:alkylmercury lyase
MSELHAHDFLGMDEATRTISYVYPLAGQATDHRVELHGRELNALCAIDALGVGGMYRTDVSVASSYQQKCPRHLAAHRLASSAPTNICSDG